MLTFMNQWIQAARFGTDVHRVVMLRMMRFAAGDANAAVEAGRMVTEKIAAFGEAQMAMLTALAKGSSLRVATARASTPYRKRVRANRLRLSR